MARGGQNPLVSCTPVMAGVRLKDLPPETPFLSSNGHTLVDQTPIMRRFAAAPGQQQQPLRQMNMMGIAINRPNQAALEQQKNNPLGVGKVMPGIRPAPGAAGAGQPLLAQIPAFKGGATKPPE